MRQATPEEGSGACWRGLRLVAVAVLSVTLLGGCLVRVVYNQLDWLTLWYLDDYLDLDAAQKDVARDIISRTLAWHRAEQLPRYAVLTRTVVATSPAEMSAGFLAQQYAEIVALWDELLRRVAPELAPLLQSLSDEQVSHLFARLAEENRDLEKDYSGITPEERRAKQDKAIIRAFGRFTGPLTREQQQLVRARAARFHDLSAEWLQRRAAWQQAFRVLLAGRKSNPRFTARLEALLLDPNQFDSPGYRRLVLENQALAFGLTAEVLATLTPAQAGRLRRRFTGYADDFDALLRAGRTEPAAAAGYAANQ